MEQKIFCEKTYYETERFKIVQPSYRRKFSYNTFLNRSQILKVVNIYRGNARAIAALKEPITEKIQSITKEDVKRVFNNFTSCIRQVL